MHKKNSVNDINHYEIIIVCQARFNVLGFLGPPLPNNLHLTPIKTCYKDRIRIKCVKNHTSYTQNFNYNMSEVV